MGHTDGSCTVPHCPRPADGGVCEHHADEQARAFTARPPRPDIPEEAVVAAINSFEGDFFGDPAQEMRAALEAALPHLPGIAQFSAALAAEARRVGELEQAIRNHRGTHLATMDGDEMAQADHLLWSYAWPVHDDETSR